MRSWEDGKAVAMWPGQPAPSCHPRRSPASTARSSGQCQLQGHYHSFVACENMPRITKTGVRAATGVHRVLTVHQCLFVEFCVSEAIRIVSDLFLWRRWPTGTWKVRKEKLAVILTTKLLRNRLFLPFSLLCFPLLALAPLVRKASLPFSPPWESWALWATTSGGLGYLFGFSVQLASGYP